MHIVNFEYKLILRLFTVAYEGLFMADKFSSFFKILNPIEQENNNKVQKMLKTLDMVNSLFEHFLFIVVYILLMCINIELDKLYIKA